MITFTGQPGGRVQYPRYFDHPAQSNAGNSGGSGQAFQNYDYSTGRHTPLPPNLPFQPPPSLVGTGAYWNFQQSVNDGGGSSHFVDVTGNGVNLNYSTGIYSQVNPGKIGLGVDQGDAAHSMVNNTNPAPLAYIGTGISHSFWVNLLSESGNFNVGPFVSIRYGATDHGIRLQNNGTGTLMNQVVVFSSGGATALTFSPQIPNLTWAFITYTLTNTGNFIFYVNAVPLLSGNNGAIAGSPNGQPIVSQQFGGSTYQIDELGMWINIVLTPNQVSFLYNGGNGAAYPFS